MTDNLTKSVGQTLETAKKIFEKRCKEYGTFWRAMSIISIADYLIMESTRINHKISKVNSTGNHVDNDLIKIIDHAIIGILQNRLGELRQEDIHMMAEEASSNYSDVILKFNDYLESQHTFLIEEIEGYNLKKISEQLIQKSQRLKNFYFENEETFDLFTRKIERLNKRPKNKEMADFFAKVTENLNKTHLENIKSGKTLIFGSLLEIILWSVIGYKTCKATQ